MVSISVKLTNTDSFPKNAVIQLKLAGNLQLLTRNEIPVALKKAETKYLPIKIFIPQRTSSGDQYQLQVVLKTGDSEISRDSCSVVVLKNKAVRLFVQQPDLLLHKNIDSIFIPIRLENKGNTDQQVSVIAKLPTVLESEIYNVINLHLAAFADTSFFYAKKITRNMLRTDDFYVNISGLYKDGNPFGMTSTRIQLARSNRSFNDSLKMRLVNGSEDFIGFDAEYLFTRNENYRMNGNNTVHFANSRLNTNFDVTLWKNAGFSSALIRNTYVKFEQNNRGFIAGNLSKSFDLPLNGRGVLLYAKDKQGRDLLEAGYMIEGYNLIGNTYKSSFQKGRSGWAGYNYYQKSFESRSTALYAVIPYSDTRTFIFNNEVDYSYDINNDFSLKLSAGQTYDGTNSTKSRAGFATDFGYSGRIKNFRISSDNFFSTPYFSGTKRGALTLNEKINWQFSKMASSWAGISFYKYKPKLLPGAKDFFINEYESRRSEIGIAINSVKNFSFSLAANSQDEINNKRFGIAQNESMSSYNLGVSGNYMNHHLNSLVSYNAEGGFYTSTIQPGQRFFHLKNRFQFQYKAFSVFALFQQGNFYLSELMNLYSQVNPGYRYLLIAPQYQKDFFKNKLKASISLSFINSNNYGDIFSFGGRLVYNISGKTRVQSGYTFNHYSSGNFDMNNFEMGFRQMLNPLVLTSANTNKLEVFVFKDVNRNGVFDANDSIASAQMVTINGNIFMTRKNGVVSYNQLPSGSYIVELPLQNGWYAPKKVVDMHETTRIEIPLLQSGKLSGTLTYTTNDYSYEIYKNLKNISITAIDANGVIHQTRTDDRGKYLFYLPYGSYTVFIPKEALGRTGKLYQ